MIGNIIEALEEFNQNRKINHFKEYNIEEGRIIFLDSDDDEIVIHSFFLKPEYQNKGILKSFIFYLSKKYNEIWFVQCNDIMNCILLTMKLEGKYFTNTGTGEHYWIRNDENSKNKYDVYELNILKISCYH